jgi:hypothetical protein
MSMITAAVIVGGSAVVGAGVSAYGATQSAKAAAKGGYQYDKYGQLNPEQKGMSGQLSTILGNALGNQTPQYEGQYSADIGAGEQNAINQQANLAGMTGNWASKFQPGYIDQEIADTTYKDLNKKFYGDALNPGSKALAEEQFAGRGGYWGDARAKGVLGEYQNTVVDPYNTWRANALQNSFQNALNYAGVGTGVNSANQQMQKITRDLQQYGLDQQYTEWVRTRPESLPYINQALQFMGLSTGTAEYKPGPVSTTGMMLQGIGSGIAGAGSSIGMMYGMSGGGTPGTTNVGNASQVGALNSSNPGVSSQIQNYNWMK